MDFEDVWVVLKAAHGVDFTKNSWFHGGIDGFQFVDNFDRDSGAID